MEEGARIRGPRALRRRRMEEGAGFVTPRFAAAVRRGGRDRIPPGAAAIGREARPDTPPTP